MSRLESDHTWMFNTRMNCCGFSLMLWNEALRRGHSSIKGHGKAIKAIFMFLEAFSLVFQWRFIGGLQRLSLRNGPLLNVT